MTVALSDDVMVSHLEGEAVALDLATKRYYRLNETAAVIWKGLEQGKCREKIVGELTERFEVDHDAAADAVEAHVAELTDLGLLATDS